MQSSAARAGTVPLKSFVGNSCTSAMTSFNTVGETNDLPGRRLGLGLGALRAGPQSSGRPVGRPRLFSRHHRRIPPGHARRRRFQRRRAQVLRTEQPEQARGGPARLQREAVDLLRRDAGRLHDHDARPLHVVLQLGPDQLRGAVATQPVVSPEQQRDHRRPERGRQLRQRRRLHRLGSHHRQLAARLQERVHRAIAAGKSRLGPGRRPLQPEVAPELRLAQRRRPLRVRQGRHHLPDGQPLRRPALPELLRRPRGPGFERLPQDQDPQSEQGQRRLQAGDVVHPGGLQPRSEGRDLLPQLPTGHRPGGGGEEDGDVHAV